MRRRQRTAVVVALASAIAGALGQGGCGGQRSEPRPLAALASSPEAATAFDAIREAWSTTRTPPAELRAMLERFLARYPLDGRAPFVQISLALVAMNEGDFAMADAQLARAPDQPRGSTHDLWIVARARRLRLKDADPEGALERLRPLVGKTVDPTVRAVFEKELVLAALASHRDYEAVSYMDAWLRASTEDEKTEALGSVATLAAEIPRDVLVGSLQAMRGQRASFGYGADIERILAQRLVQIATTSDDAELARILLDADPTAISAAGDAGARLGELATSRRGLNVVEGRTVGLLLPTGSPALRDESADVLRGLMWALGLPRGVRAPARPGTAAWPTAEPCAPLDPAPDADEPRVEDGIRLVTRDDEGSADRTEVSLDELVGDGAALVIAGLDEQTAARALRWGDNHAVPVIGLVAPDGDDPDRDAPRTPASFGFLLGERRTRVMAALARGAPSLVSTAAAPVADASELALFAPQGGPLAGLLFGPPVSCDMPAARAGEARFPLAQWEMTRTHGWVVSGSPECAADLVGELSAVRARGIVGLALEAASLPAHAPSLRVTTVHAGVVPYAAPGDPREDELRRFSAALGRMGWWSALGRDAATLARAALLKLPVDSVTDAHAVADRRAHARDAIAAARARLWTTEASGWEDGRNIKRSLCTIDVPPR